MDSKKVLAIVAIFISILALSGVVVSILGNQSGTFALFTDSNSESITKKNGSDEPPPPPPQNEGSTKKRSISVSDAQDYYLQMGPKTILTLKAKKKGISDVEITLQPIYMLRGHKVGQKLFLTGVFINSIKEGGTSAGTIAKTFRDPKEEETALVGALRTQYNVDNFFDELDEFIKESAKNRQATAVAKSFRRFLVNPSFSALNVTGLDPYRRFLEELFGPKSYYSQS